MTVIAIAPAGAVEEMVMAEIEQAVSSTFDASVVRIDPLAEPSYAWDEQRRQYSSTAILKEALSARPADADKMLVVTERDLFIPMLSFVYGQAQLDGALAVLSVARLRQEFYRLPANDALFLLRIRKEAQHELGHCLGLTHCADHSCTMSLSTNIRHVDEKNDEFCAGCTALSRGVVRARGAHT